MKDVQGFALVILLIVYLTLLCGTGYIAFFEKTTDPSAESYKISTDYTVYENASSIEDSGARQAYIQTLAMLAESSKKKYEFAFQTFNIVLGATLGFLSALATKYVGSAIGQRTRSPEDVRQSEA